MKVLLMMSYMMTIADAYYASFFTEHKTPPQLQLAQTSSFAIDYAR